MREKLVVQIEQSYVLLLAGLHPSDWRILLHLLDEIKSLSGMGARRK